MDRLEPSISRTRISAILDAGGARVGEHVVVGGWVLKVSDGSCLAALQAVVEAGLLRSAPLAHLTPMGTSVLLEGKLKKPPRNSKERVELHVDRVIEVGEVDDAYPLHKSMTKPENFRDLVHLRARTNTV
jgi:asparaginyl-tRNA synthetase